MDDFIWPAEKAQAVPQESPPSYHNHSNYTNPPPHETAPGPPPTYNHKRTPSQEAIYIKELKAWAAEKEKMYPGAYGEYGNVTLANTSLSNPRIPRMSETRQASSNEQNHTADTDAYDQSGLAADSIPGNDISIPSTRRKDSVGEGEYESAKRPGSSSNAPKGSGIKRRMSSFMSKIGMSKTETKTSDNDVGSEGLGTGV